MARRGNALAMGTLLLAAAVVCAAAAAEADDLLVELQLQQDPCPQVEDIVRSAVQKAVRRNIQLTAGLLRIFFHDCFPQGCDASVLLAGERDVPPNAGSLQPEALKLIEDIRREVHGKCGGPKVSCADILALATRDAVVAAGLPFFPITRGRMDTRTPAPDVLGNLPSPSDSVGNLLDMFRRKGLGDDPRVLVALSGGHTVGKTSCGLIRGNDDFSRALAANCSASRSRKQSLDVITPDAFDNRYFVALRNGKGVLGSDQGLADHPSTRDIVRDFANDQQLFFTQFRASMTKLSQLKAPAGGSRFEIRLDCSKPNARVGDEDDAAAGQLAAAA
ncbi:hypothetical protein SEVIR_3G005800v4 [Setaria viridis]|uniref:Peroxidase n=2 Tax=Setaria TaxID=4554 RepID=K3Z7V2_SETIT|nr:cationic peroxidase SPC4 [Setaria italica]XP_034584391.1 cationic peroxidase SPC4-like [Setaria viridis]RCV14773.1 hypothetical protein SETIT_3G004900v2 [Setaria italica]TKW23723.1 hypothetical protein SEVIR_3G005800v2 [Setaria viridis]